MSDDRALFLRDERNRKFAGPAQRADDVLLGMTRVRRVQEGGNRHRFDRLGIIRRFLPYLHLHGDVGYVIPS